MDINPTHASVILTPEILDSFKTARFAECHFLLDLHAPFAGWLLLTSKELGKGEQGN
jgi:hypothetical protein